MKRLTFHEDNGNWGVEGVGEVYSVDEKIYRCLDKLKDYEDIGLNPDEVENLILRVENLESRLNIIIEELGLLKENIK